MIPWLVLNISGIFPTWIVVISAFTERKFIEWILYFVFCWIWLQSDEIHICIPMEKIPICIMNHHIYKNNFSIIIFS